MAKIIRVTPEHINQVREEFEQLLKSGKFADGKISYSKIFLSEKRPCTVYFTETAWIKMQTLIQKFDKEVGWHGIAYRGDDPNKDEYIIKDILVYPQEVTGVTVTTDQIKYQEWLMSQEDDVFNNIRMQGHSHVNMGVTPSGVDNALYEDLLAQLSSSMFYIFLIYNKRGEYTYKVYDLAKNIMFETSDVTVSVIDDGIGLEKFIADAKELVKDKPPIIPVYNAAYQKSYYGNYYNPVKAIDQEQKQEQKQEAKQETKKDPKKEPEKKQGNRKMKRSQRKPVKSKVSSFGYRDYYDDDFDDPYGPFGYSDYYYE